MNKIKSFKCADCGIESDKSGKIGSDLYFGNGWFKKKRVLLCNKCAFKDEGETKMLIKEKELNKRIAEIKKNAEKNVMRQQIKLLEENIHLVIKQYKEKTGEDYNKTDELAMDRVLKRIYGKSKTAIVNDKEFKQITEENGYDIRGASALFKKHLVKLAWDRVGLTQEGQFYVEAL